MNGTAGFDIPGPMTKFRLHRKKISKWNGNLCSHKSGIGKMWKVCRSGLNGLSLMKARCPSTEYTQSDNWYEGRRRVAAASF